MATRKSGSFDQQDHLIQNLDMTTNGTAFEGILLASGATHTSQTSLQEGRLYTVHVLGTDCVYTLDGTAPTMSGTACGMPLGAGQMREFCHSGANATLKVREFSGLSTGVFYIYLSARSYIGRS